MWKQIFQICFKTVKDNDLIWMQYRVSSIKKLLLLFKIKSDDDGKSQVPVLLQLMLFYLAAKLYICRTSKSNRNLNCVTFYNFLKKIYLELEYVAKLEMKYSNFMKIWGNFNLVFLLT